MVEIEKTEIDGNEMKSGEEVSAGTGTGAAMGVQANPFDRYAVVSLLVPGLMTGKSTFQDHVRMVFFRMKSEQINKIVALKVKFYRETKKLSAFRLDGKYIVPVQNMKIIDDIFREIHIEFQSEKKEIFKDLTANWSTYVDEVFREFPNFLIDRDKINEMTPDADDFIGMEYVTKTLSAYVGEHAGLANLVQDAATLSPDLQRKLDTQRSLVTAKIRQQYQAKMEELQNLNEKLRNIVKRNGKRYEKLSMKMESEAENYVNMAEILGEKDSAKVQIDAMMELLAESHQSRP
jgi:hypothetical protein